MKKIFAMLVALCCSFSAFAFEFDGIDLNADLQVITRAVSARGYTYDVERGCLTGDCQGTPIYMFFKQDNATQKGKLAALEVIVPSKDANFLANAQQLFTVIYHVDANNAGSYSVSADGTTLNVEKCAEGIKLVYKTPYFKK